MKRPPSHQRTVDTTKSRIRMGNGAENFSRLSRIALNLLRREPTRKAGIKTKRLIAGWDNDHLPGLLIG